MRYTSRLRQVFLIGFLFLGMSFVSFAQGGASVSVRLESNNTACGRDVYFSLRGFAPNSPITNSSSSTERNCEGQIISSGWSGWAIGNTDAAGNKEFSVIHGAYGSYTYTFTDGVGNSASVTFNYGGSNGNTNSSPPANPAPPSNPETPSNPEEPEAPHTVICPSGTGPSGIVAGNYDPTSLTQAQRDWLWQGFEGEAPPAPVGYGGKDCVSGDGNTQTPNNGGINGEDPIPNQPPIDYGSISPVGERSVRITAEVGLNIRAGQGTNFQIIGRAVYNRWFEVIGGSENGWYLIRFNQGEGWVSAAFVDYRDNTPPSDQTSTRVPNNEVSPHPSITVHDNGWCSAVPLDVGFYGFGGINPRHEMLFPPEVDLNEPLPEHYFYYKNVWVGPNIVEISLTRGLHGWDAANNVWRVGISGEWVGLQSLLSGDWADANNWRLDYYCE